METRVHTGYGPCRRLAPFPLSLLLIGMLVGSMGAQSMANAAAYYLNTASGNDSDLGTVDHPWKTLVKVQSGASAGDTIVIQSADAATYAAKWPTQVSYKARVVQQFTITWTFDTDYSVGQFANGDFWVVGPVKIVGIDPPSTSVDGRVTNGSMVNPRAGWGLAEGYDSAMPNNDYDPALNVAYSRSAANPLVLGPDSSLVSASSLSTVGGKTTLDRAAILTVLGASARTGDFRPPYCGTDKTPRFNVSMLSRSLLQSLPRVASTRPLAEVENYFAAPWLDHAGGWMGDQIHPRSNMPDYGREIHNAIGIGALMLHLNFPLAQKETLLRRFVQVGIDLYGVVANGGINNWRNAGGEAGGRKWPILFAGIMLNDAAMKAIGVKSGDYLCQNGYGPGHCPPDYIHFGEDDQTFYVAQVDVDATHSPKWCPDARDGVRTPYDANDLQLPEWGIEHSTDPYQSNRWIGTTYRNVAGPPFHSTALAALLTPGAKALWNHNAYFDYTDRYMDTIFPPGGNYESWWRSESDFTAAMWDTYRAQCGPIWPAVDTGAPVLSLIGDQQITTGQTLTLTLKSISPNAADLTYSASGLPAGATFSGQTFTWTPSAAQAGVYRVTFTIDDGKYQDSKTITITVTKENSAPVLAAIGNQSVSENQPLMFALSAADADGDAITYSATDLPAGATLTGQTFSWTPTYSQAGSYNVTLAASDGQAQSSQTIAIAIAVAVANIDRPPVLADIDAKSMDLGNSLSFALSATDPDGDSLAYSAATLPSGATLTGQTFTWTPVSGQGGSYPITFTVSDGALTDTGTVMITVASAAQDPTAPVVAQCTPAPAIEGIST